MFGLDRDPREMTDAEIDAALAKQYPPEDFDVTWWWDWPEDKVGFCVSASFKHVMTMKDFEENLYG